MRIKFYLRELKFFRCSRNCQYFVQTEGSLHRIKWVGNVAGKGAEEKCTNNSVRKVDNIKRFTKNSNITHKIHSYLN
jgi:hypothetical protein